MATKGIELHRSASTRRIVETSTEDHEPIHNVTPHDFPDGGLEAWLVVFGAFCALFLVFSMVASTAVFQDYLSAHQLQGVPPAKVGWIFSVNLFLTFFCGIYTGQFFDTYGPRFMIAVGSICLVLSIMLLSICMEYWQFVLVYGVLGGFGGALLLSASFPSIGHYFQVRRAYAQGIANTAGSVGGIVIPLMLRELVGKVGFAWSARILGFIFLAVSIPANLFIKARFKGNTRTRLLPNLAILRQPGFLLFALGMFMMEWGLFIPVAYLASFTTWMTQQESLGYVVVAVYNVGTFFGRWLPGLVADKVGRINVSVVSMIMSCITILAFWLPDTGSVPLLFVFAVAFGFASGSNTALIPACLSQFCPIEEYGTYFSTAYFLSSFG